MSSNAIFVLIPSLSGHSAVVNYGFYYNAHFVQVEQFVRFALSLDSVSITALHVITSLPSSAFRLHSAMKKNPTRMLVFFVRLFLRMKKTSFLG
jgi:hypothetical protein